MQADERAPRVADRMPAASQAMELQPRAGAAARPHIAVLGAGPAGVAAAWQLARRGLARVTVLEARDAPGGNAGSFELEGVYCDYGSHRLHPVVEPRILRDLRELLGDELLLRQRRGLLRLGGRWIRFPLRPFDLAAKLPPRFLLGVMLDAARRFVPGGNHQPETFASVLRRGLGDTICREFYFPYGRKIWGVEPDALDAAAARRRVSAGTVGRMLRKVAGQLPGLRSAMAGKFYYPRRGYGQISDALHAAAVREGAEFRFGARVTAIERQANGVACVRFEQGGCEQRLSADSVWSTLPLNLTLRCVQPAAPPEVLAAARRLRFRGMLLIYLVLAQPRFGDADAYYFPEPDIPITRLSEPKNYSGADAPRHCTVLCAELPCDSQDMLWQQDDASLGRSVCQWIRAAGLPLADTVRRVETRRLPHAYPIYDVGYAQHQRRVEEWLGGIEGLVLLGRQGLFAHDNIHHTLATAYAAADCLGADGCFDRRRWGECLERFQDHVVED
jgi:protoporphyrinogen oxidase